MSVLLPKGEFCCLRVRVSSDSSDGRTGTRAPPTVSHFNLNFKKLQGRWPHCWADRWSVRGTLKKITDLFTVLQSKKKNVAQTWGTARLKLDARCAPRVLSHFLAEFRVFDVILQPQYVSEKCFMLFEMVFFGHSDTFFSLWNLREMVTKKRRDGWL